MRKFVIVIVAAFSLNVSAQKLQEAEFIGNVRITCITTWNQLY